MHGGLGVIPVDAVGGDFPAERGTRTAAGQNPVPYAIPEWCRPSLYLLQDLGWSGI